MKYDVEENICYTNSKTQKQTLLTLSTRGVILTTWFNATMKWRLRGDNNCQQIPFSLHFKCLILLSTLHTAVLRLKLL